jgi:hypothetical protein
MHGGETIFVDEAAFAKVISEGKVGPIRNVADGGADYKGFLSLSDNSFLLVDN